MEVTLLLRVIQEKLGFDYVYANQLEIKDGKLTGAVLGEIVVDEDEEPVG